MASDPVAELREAARLIRERAGATIPGPWSPRTDVRDGSYREDVEPPRTERVIGEASGVAICGTRADADHIAGWHPLVALAVADLLDKIAWMGEMDRDQLGRVGCDEAIAIARIYLGRDDA